MPADKVTCPQCGAENPRSLLITICQQCKGSLTGPAKAPAAPSRPAPPAQPAPSRPVALPPRSEDAARPAGGESGGPWLTAERAQLRSKASDEVTGCLIVSVALLAFGIGFAILMAWAR